MKTIKSTGYIDIIIDGETVRLKTVKGNQCTRVIQYDENNELLEIRMLSDWSNLEFITIYNYVILLTKNDLSNEYTRDDIINKRLQRISNMYKILSSEIYTEIKNFTKYEVI